MSLYEHINEIRYQENSGSDALCSYRRRCMQTKLIKYEIKRCWLLYFNSYNRVLYNYVSTTKPLAKAKVCYVSVNNYPMMLILQFRLSNQSNPQYSIILTHSIYTILIPGKKKILLRLPSIRSLSPEPSSICEHMKKDNKTLYRYCNKFGVLSSDTHFLNHQHQQHLYITGI